MWSKFNSFVEAMAEKKHDLGADALKLALTNTAPVATNAVLGDITQISSAGGYAPIALPITNSAQAGGTYTLANGQATFTASGASFDPFRYVVLYNDTAPDKNLIGWFDYGIAYTLPDGQPFSVAAGTILTIA